MHVPFNNGHNPPSPRPGMARPLRLILLASLLVTVTLAGCGSKGSTGTETMDFTGTETVDVRPTDTTGIIRGIVVDSAIRPIAGVLLTVQTQEGVLATNSTSAGAFGFEGLKPGTYFVKAQKAGFLPIQASTEVVAGEANPQMVKMQMENDAAYVRPYYTVYSFKGFIECGIVTPGVGLAACSFPNGCQPGFGLCLVDNGNLTNDQFSQFLPVGSRPMHIQHELIWQSTQSTGTQFSLAMRTATQEQYNGGQYDADIDGVTGESPVVGRINETGIRAFDIGGNGTGLAPAVFSGGMAGTGSQVCVPNQFCLFDTGATVQQDFQMYTHIFFGFAPAPDWQFSVHGDPPVPK
jgi:hypothetical protein